MSLLNPHLLGWVLRVFAKKLGLWGFLALCVICISCIVYYSGINKVQQEIYSLEHTIAEKEIRSTETTETEVPTLPNNSLQTLSTFYQTFPTALSIPDTFAKLNMLANQHQLTLNSGDYKLNKVSKSDSSEPQILTQYEMVLPIEGSYPNVRSFISDILSTLSSVAVTDIQMNRENTQSPKVEARLQMILYVREDAR